MRNSLHICVKRMSRRSFCAILAAIWMLGDPAANSCAEANDWYHVGDDIESEVEKSPLFRMALQDEPAESDTVAPPQPLADLLNLPLEELARQRVRVPGSSPGALTTLDVPSFTPTSPDQIFGSIPRVTPAAVTRIDYESIWQSGARDLDETLDIFVPNVQIIRHEFEQDQLGTRGIYGAFGDKFLLRVNDRQMNHLGKFGAMSERDLPLLGDIHHIDYIRGPGSGIYGPGALGSVINIVTHTGLTFQGTDATVRQGAVENFTAAEVRHGRKFSDDEGLFLYYGLADYNGASQGDSPLVYGRSSGVRGGGAPIVAGEPVPFPIVNDHAAHRGHLKHKVHLQYNNGNFESWIRYTQSGEQRPPLERDVALAPIGVSTVGQDINDALGRDAGYQQLTALAKYTWELSDDFNVETMLSYDFFDFERLALFPEFSPGGSTLAYLEEKIYGRVLARWNPLERHSFAFGAEYFDLRFSDGLGYPDIPITTNRFPLGTTPWEADQTGLLGEYQVRPTDKITMFLGGRADKHQNTDWFYSPRVALILMPTEEDTVKLLVNQSVRRSSDDDLRAQFVANGTKGLVETLQSAELRYENQSCEELFAAVSGFYIDTEIVDFNQGLLRTDKLGNYNLWGIEAETTYRTERTRLIASHSYIKLIEFSLTDPNTIQGFSAQPYGYGSDLASWSNHITKIAVMHDLDCYWTASASLRYYWGFPGGRDLSEFHNARFAASGTTTGFLGLTDPNYNKAFEESVFLNLGLERKLRRNGSVRLDLFNVLGWIEEDLNKRNYLVRVGAYRVEAPAVAVSARLEF